MTEMIVGSQSTKEWIEDQKKAWGDVYKVTEAGVDYFYRSVSRAEYKDIRQELAVLMSDKTDPNADLVAEEKIVKKCLLAPTDIDAIFKKAGIVSLLAAHIFEVSGFLQPSEVSEPEKL